MTTTAVVVILVLLLRQIRYFFHDFHHLFPRAAARWQSGVLAVLLLLLPLGLHLGLVPVLLVLFLAMVLYLSLAERLVVGGLIALLGVIPVLGGLLAGAASFSGTPAADSRALEQGGLAAREAAARVDARHAEGKAAFAELFALGRYELRRGQLDSAIKHFQAAAALRNNDARLVTNLASAMLVKGDMDGAQDLYESAAAADPKLAAPHFNLSLLHARRAASLPPSAAAPEIGKAQVSRITAEQLDESLLQRREPEGESHAANRLLLLPALTDRELDALAASPEVAAKVEVQLSLPLLGKVSGPWAFGYPGLFAALLVGLGFVARKVKASRSCEKCGRAACQRCVKDLPPGGALCGQCVNVFTRKGTVSAPVRVRKQLEVDRHRERMDRLSYLLGLLCSGAGHLFRGQPVRGALYAFLFLASAFGAFLRNGAMRVPYGTLPLLLRLLPVAVVLLAVYLFSLRGLYRQRSE